MVELDVGKYLKEIAHKWKFVLAATVLFAVLFYGIARFLITPMYQSTITLYVQNTTNYQGNISEGDITSAQGLLNTCVALFSSDYIMQQISDKYGLGLTAKQMAKMVSADAVDKTEIFHVTVTNANPYFAQKVAGAIGDEFPAIMQRIISPATVVLVDKASLNLIPASPNRPLFTLIGGLIGFLLVCIFILVKEVADIKIRSEEDLKQIANIPIIGVIPEDN